MEEESKGLGKHGDADITSEMYLRDGAPHATVCKVTLSDGRVGIGVYRGPVDAYDNDICDAYARRDALVHMPLENDPTDTQAALGHPARI